MAQRSSLPRQNLMVNSKEGGLPQEKLSQHRHVSKARHKRKDVEGSIDAERNSPSGKIKWRQTTLKPVYAIIINSKPAS